LKLQTSPDAVHPHASICELVDLYVHVQFDPMQFASYSLPALSQNDATHPVPAVAAPEQPKRFPTGGGNTHIAGPVITPPELIEPLELLWLVLEAPLPAPPAPACPSSTKTTLPPQPEKGPMTPTQSAAPKSAISRTQTCRERGADARAFVDSKLFIVIPLTRRSRGLGWLHP
jgi:hypothetical protein